MHTRVLAFLGSAAILLPAQEPRPVRVEGADAAFARTLAAASAAVAAARDAPPRRGKALAMHVLGCLRLGDVAASEAALAAAEVTAATDDDDAPRGDPTCDDAWLVVAHLWHVRASGDTGLPRRRWAPLLRAAQRLGAARAPDTFAAAALRVHALFCVGALADARDRGVRAEPEPAGGPGARPGNRWTERAITAQLELERVFWLEQRGSFAGTPSADATAPDASLLLPAGAGLLIASGDRMPRHLAHALDAVLAAPERGPADATEDAALCLAAAAQLLDDAARERAWTRVLRACDAEPGGAPAGRVLDALLAAVTGVRVATGAGVDEGWLRCAPWLPPGHGRLDVRNALANGCRLDLELTARSGPRGADEADASACLGGDGPRLHVRLVLAHTRDGGPRPVIVAGAVVQTVQWMQPGDAFVCSLPRAQTQPQHDARALGGRRAREPAVGEGIR